MRTLTDIFQDAIENESGIRYYWQLTLYKTRYSFKVADLVDKKPASWTLDDGTNLVDNLQSVSSNGDVIYTLRLNGTSLDLASSGSGSAVALPFAHTNGYRPGFLFPYVYGLHSNTLSIYAIDPVAILAGTVVSGNVTTTNINIATTTGSGSDGVFYPTQILTVGDEVTHYGMLMWIKDGGIACATIQILFVGGTLDSYIVSVYPYRIMLANKVYSSTSADDVKLLNFSGATRTILGDYIYLSVPDGRVLGLHVPASGVWEDEFVAMPSDLSKFVVCNVASYNDRIFLSGQFQRWIQMTADIGAPLSIGSRYNLLPWSDDGKIFSVDRYVGISYVGYPFQVVILPNDILAFTTSNKFYISDANYSVSREDTLCNTVEVISVRGDPNTTINVRLPNGDELIDKIASYANKGTFCYLECGVLASRENTETHLMEDYIEWMGYQHCVVVKRNSGYPSRAFSLDIQQEGLWRLTTQTYPWYLEVNSKSSTRDDITDQSNGALDSGASTSGIPEPFSMDFWFQDNGYAGGGLYEHSHAASASNEYWTGDLVSRGLSEYPMINQFPFDVKIYGWSRIGIPSGAWVFDADDTTPYTNPNDDFQLELTVRQVLPESSGGTTIQGYSPVSYGPERTIVIPLDTSGSGAHTYPPQTWKTNPDGSPVTRSNGSYPVIYAISDGGTDITKLMLNDQIINIGVIAHSTSPCVNYMERVEIPLVEMIVAQSQVRTEVLSVTESNLSNWAFPTDLQGWFGFHSDYGGGVYSTQIWDGSHGHTTNGCVYINTYPTPPSPNRRISGIKIIPSDPIIVHEGDEISVWSKKISESRSGNGTTTNITEMNIILSDGSNLLAFSVNQSVGTWDELIFTIPSGYDGTTISYIEISGSSNSQSIAEWYFDDINLTVAGMDTSVHTIKKINILARGTPIVMLSGIPYTTFDFEAGAEFLFSGEGSTVGIVGLASDTENYVVGRITDTTAQLCKVRNNVHTILCEESITKPTGNHTKVMLTLKGGEFNLRVWSGGIVTDPILTYLWAEDDGVMSINADIMHIGVYAFINVPHFRVAGFQPGLSTVIGLSAGYDPTAVADFASSGTVVIEGNKYTYTGKTPTTNLPRGPFQLRAGSSEHRPNPDDGQVYSGPAWEFGMFEWLSNPTHHDDWHNYALCESNGSAGVVDSIDYKSWITSGGQVAYFRNRARAYLDKDLVGTSSYDQIFLTHGLTGVSAISLVGSDTGTIQHPVGAYCFKDSDNTIEIYSFFGSSSNPLDVIEDMIEQIALLAGAKSKFTGDYLVPTHNLASGTPWEIQEAL